MNKEKMDDDLVDDVFEEDDPNNYYHNVDTGVYFIKLLAKCYESSKRNE